MRQQDYITIVRNNARILWNSINELKAPQAEWNALDYSNTLETPTSGENAGITAVMVGAVVFDTANAATSLLGEGHATNLAKLL